jgi:hypothetical protein
MGSQVVFGEKLPCEEISVTRCIVVVQQPFLMSAEFSSVPIYEQCFYIIR